MSDFPGFDDVEDPSEDPFENPENDVVDWTTHSTGQYNQKIVSGPDAGVHRFYDPNNARSGQTGTERY